MNAHAHSDLFDRILSTKDSAFARLSRPESGMPGMLDVLVGDMLEVDTISEIPLDALEGWDVLVVVPFRQLMERGFDAPDDGAPLLAMKIKNQAQVPLNSALTRLPDLPTIPVDGHFDQDDEEYADLVKGIIKNEIGNGEGANFVIKRSFLADISDWSPQAGLSLFRRLLEQEQTAYWTFIIHDGERTLIGASPERHISLQDGVAVMNPISGTYRYPRTGPTLEGVLGFLSDPKEIDELFMVVDEELKMMARISSSGGRISGPNLKEMKRLAHTEYFIEGRTEMDVRQILRETMFAPTVTGSPLENAARVIARYEPQGRRYYSGIAALIGNTPEGVRQLDSSILIRTAEVDTYGKLRIDVGATLVRNSDPSAETAETKVKLAALLDALEPPPSTSTNFGTHPQVRAALLRRNTTISDFWLDQPNPDPLKTTNPTNLMALIIDAEDTFTAMLAVQLQSLGLDVEVRGGQRSLRCRKVQPDRVGPRPRRSTGCRPPESRSLTISPGRGTGSTTPGTRRMPESPSTVRPARPRSQALTAAQPRAGAGIGSIRGPGTGRILQCLRRFLRRGQVRSRRSRHCGAQPEQRNR